MAEQERQLPLRRAETAAAFVLVVQAVAGVVAWLLGRGSGSLAAEAAAWQLLVGAVVWLSCLMHQRLRRLADEESREAEALREQGRAEGTSLFEADEGTLLTARHRLEQFERYFLPVVSILILVAEAGLSWYLLRRAVAGAAGGVERALMTAVVFFGIAFVSFLLAKYTAGLATQAAWRPVRPGANRTMACAATSFLVGVALVCVQFEVPIVERVVAYVVAGLLGLLAIETLLLLVMGIYRPRVAGREPRWAHDSRLLGMLSTSGGILRTTAETLDYQFGFKVSETWFYKFMERAIAPLVFFQLVTFYLLTCFVIVEQGEQAIVERFGKPREGEALGPGLHLKWPWPIEAATKHPVGRVEMLAIGEQLKEDVEGYTWTVSHAREEFNLLVANRPRPEEGRAEDTPARPTAPGGAPAVSLLTGTVYVYYSVANLHDYLYDHRDPRRTLEEICYRELTAYAARTDYLDFLGHKIGEAAATLERAIQAEADRLKLGIRIAHVTLQGLHPPAALGADFEAVVGALQEKEAKVWDARKQQVAIVAEAEAKAHRLVSEAKVYGAARVAVTPAIAARFETQLEAYLKAPEVFQHRARISAWEAALGDVRKIITPRWMLPEVLQLNLEDRLRPGLGLDLESADTEER
jgi:regulator of protease activity HflC (stomatin/prohibitin superfamily)